MEQLTQELKSGRMEIMEVPFPVIGRGQVLVHNLYSAISTGTEGKTVSDARKGYIAKARSRKKDVLQVIGMIRSTGLLNTYKTVMNKLEAPSSLGYSCAGEVIAVGEGVRDLQAGDLVACGGQGAYHAEVVAVWRNLCAKVPAGVDMRHAACTTIGSIALQGVRQADLKLGETCVVIGLGIIGQLTIRLLSAAGVRAIGIDIDGRQVQAARDGGAALAFLRGQVGLEQLVMDFTSGIGSDAVIITAGTSSADPVELAGVLSRPKGRVVIVGAVPTGFSRTHYYRKELDLRMSCSYGPGRYDPSYEEKGADYPVGYVRWTENRNMQAFLSLLQAGKIGMDTLITHEFELEAAPNAYSMILERKEHFLGVLIRYDQEAEPQRSVVRKQASPPAAEMAVGFIGVGNFAQNILLPRLKGLARMVGVCDAMAGNSRHVADKYDFAYCTDSPEKLIGDEKINTVFIATRHHLHARYVIAALQAGKNVYVEKPLAMNEAELEEIRRAFEQAPGSPRLMVGFNRRFSPFIHKVMGLFPAEAPKSLNFRVNAGVLPREHWVNDLEIGGGRIIGEACHFIDLAMFVAGGRINAVHALAMKEAGPQSNTVVINLSFANGSVAGISYFSNGGRDLPKEYLEIFCSGATAVIDDFRALRVVGAKSLEDRSKTQDKGHAEELRAFAEAIRNGRPSPVPFAESHLSMLATFKVLESLSQGRVVSLPC